MIVDPEKDHKITYSRKYQKFLESFRYVIPRDKIDLFDPNTVQKIEEYTGVFCDFIRDENDFELADKMTQFVAGDAHYATSVHEWNKTGPTLLRTYPIVSLGLHSHNGSIAMYHSFSSINPASHARIYVSTDDRVTNAIPWRWFLTPDIYRLFILYGLSVPTDRDFIPTVTTDPETGRKYVTGADRLHSPMQWKQLYAVVDELGLSWASYEANKQLADIH